MLLLLLLLVLLLLLLLVLLLLVLLLLVLLRAAAAGSCCRSLQTPHPTSALHARGKPAPVLDEPLHPGEVGQRRQRPKRKQRARGERHQNARPLLLGVLVQVKVPDPPVADGGEELQGCAQEGLILRGGV